MFNTLRSRILLVFGTVVFLTAGAISFFAQRGMETAVWNAGERHARDLVNTMLLSVENEYRSLVFQREAMLERRKAELKNVVTLAITHLEEDFRAFRDGRLSEEEAQHRALEELRALRYEDGAGYLFIINSDSPTPRVLMHPILPELEGRAPDDPRRVHLVQAMAGACREAGEGFVEYH